MKFTLSIQCDTIDEVRKLLATMGNDAPSTVAAAPSSTALDTSMIGFGSSAPAQPPASAGPAPSAPATPSSHAGGDRDSKGVPYDSRIHSEERTKNKDGTWRKRKGLADGEYDRIMAEITSASVPANLPPLPAMAGPSAAAPFPAPPTNVVGFPAPPVAPPAPPTQPSKPFTDLMAQVRPHIKSPEQPYGTLEQSDLTTVAQQIGCVDADGIGSLQILADPANAGKVAEFQSAVAALIQSRMK